MGGHIQSHKIRMCPLGGHILMFSQRTHFMGKSHGHNFGHFPSKKVRLHGTLFKELNKTSKMVGLNGL